MISEVLWLAKRGWPIFPCKPGEKVPAVRSGFKAASAESGRLRRWWTHNPSYNVGLATGELSGLVVLDVDPRNGGDATLGALLDEHGPLPRTVTVETAGGGWHVYFAHPGEPVTSRAHALGRGVDVKADGGYIIAPPSRIGERAYRWRISPDDAVPAPMPGWMLAMLKRLPVKRERESQSSGNETPTQLESPLLAADPLSLCSPVSTVSTGGTARTVSTVSIQEVIMATLPEAPGQRHRKLFDLARALKAVPELAVLKLRELRPLVMEWHQLGKVNMSGEHDADATWAEFCATWPCVKHALGEGPLAEVMAWADAQPPPACVADRGERVRRLAALCRELQRRSGDEPFFLAARSAGDVLGINRTDTARLLNMLCVDGVLELVSKGHTGRASEYRFLAGGLTTA